MRPFRPISPRPISARSTALARLALRSCRRGSASNVTDTLRKGSNMRIQMTAAALALAVSSVAYADPLTCNLTAYKATTGLTAVVTDSTLAVTWDGDNRTELRMRFAIDAGTPIVRELAIRRKGGQWSTLATNLTPEFRVVSGLRRATQ